MLAAVTVTTGGVVVVHDEPEGQLRVREHGLPIVGVQGCGHVNVTVAGQVVTKVGDCITPGVVGLGGCGHDATIR